MANIIVQSEWTTWKDVYRFSRDWGVSVGQTFTMPYTADVSRVQLYMKRYDNGWTTDYLFQLREGIPGGGGFVHAVLPFNSSELSTTFSWVAFDFTSVELTEGEVYHWFVTQPDYAGTSIAQTPRVQIAFHFGGDIYAGGTAYGYSLANPPWRVDGDGSHDYAFIVGIGRQITLSSPEDTDIDITVQPLLEWAVGGTGLQDGDSFSVYLRAGDSDFTSSDLLQSGIEDLDLQVISGLIYNILYYWQVIADSVEGDLVDSAIESFTTLLFYPPLPTGITLDGDGEPTGDALGTNCIVTLKRLIAAANNKVFYET